MRKFWGLFDNGTYRVGCNGTTIYVFNQENRELAKFKDISYAYQGAFQPKTNIFVAKSIEGRLAVYDLERLMLKKKISITRIGAQDEGFSFSPDGAYFYNIEKPKISTHTQLTIYDTTDYSIKEILFSDCNQILLDEIEFDESSNCLILGYFRDEQNLLDYGFVGKLIDRELHQIKKLQPDLYRYMSSYYHWKRSGFTDRALEWSPIRNYDNKPNISLKELFDQAESLLL